MSAPPRRGRGTARGAPRPAKAPDATRRRWRNGRRARWPRPPRPARQPRRAPAPDPAPPGGGWNSPRALDADDPGQVGSGLDTVRVTRGARIRLLLVIQSGRDL